MAGFCFPFGRSSIQLRAGREIQWVLEAGEGESMIKTGFGKKKQSSLNSANTQGLRRLRWEKTACDTSDGRALTASNEVRNQLRDKTKHMLIGIVHRSVGQGSACTTAYMARHAPDANHHPITKPDRGL